MNNYVITLLCGPNDNERQFEIHNVKTISYDNDSLYFFGEDNKLKFILKHDKYLVGKI